jgi:hypothetical protein
LVGEHNRVFQRTIELAAESEERLGEEIGIPVTAIMASFPVPQRGEAGGRSTPSSATSMEYPPKEAIEATAKMLRAGWHPVQIKALTILTERIASPKEIAVELGMTATKAGQVSYHVKELLKRGLVQLVRTEPRRGACEHFYRAMESLIVMDADAQRMSLEERLSFSCWIICRISADLALALESGTIDKRTDRHLSRFPLHLDERGYLELVEEHNRVFHRTIEIADESERRLRQSDEGALPVSAIMASFPMPPLG